MADKAKWRARLAAALPYIIAVALSLAVAGLLIAYTAQLRSQQAAACAFSADIGSASVPDKPVPSRLAISLISDSRSWWRGNHCPGSLPPPRGFARWAKHYGLDPR